MLSSVEIIAHRGYSAKAPENTLAALEAAVEAGADAVEFDIQTAACGTPVLFHDDMLSRTSNGVGPIRRRTRTQLQGLDAGSWFSKDFAEERIPTLEDSLEALEGRLPRVYAEVKGFRELEDVDRMASLIRDAGMLDTVIVIAMNWTLLDRMRSQEPELQIGYIVEKEDRMDEALRRAHGDPAALVDVRADFVAGDNMLVPRARAADIDVAVWTVDEPSDAQLLYEAGIRRITTNEVEALLEWKRSL